MLDQVIYFAGSFACQKTPQSLMTGDASRPFFCINPKDLLLAMLALTDGCTIRPAHSFHWNLGQ